MTSVEARRLAGRPAASREPLGRADRYIVGLLATLPGSTLIGFVTIGGQLLEVERRIGGLHTGMERIRTEVHKEIGGLRTEMREEIGKLSELLAHVRRHRRIELRHYRELAQHDPHSSRSLWNRHPGNVGVHRRPPAHRDFESQRVIPGREVRAGWAVGAARAPDPAEQGCAGHDPPGVEREHPRHLVSVTVRSSIRPARRRQSEGGASGARAQAAREAGLPTGTRAAPWSVIQTDDRVQGGRVNRHAGAESFRHAPGRIHPEGTVGGVRAIGDVVLVVVIVADVDLREHPAPVSAPAHEIGHEDFGLNIEAWEITTSGEHVEHTVDIQMRHDAFQDPDLELAFHAPECDAAGVACTTEECSMRTAS